MDRALNSLRESVCDPSISPDISDEEFYAFASESVVVLPVGGEGSRFRSITDGLGIQKNALRLPNGETLVERTIRLYREEGFRTFVALVFHRAQSIVDVLGNGESLGVQISYSYDPEMPVGRGGAIRNAIANNTIPPNKSLIIHNPDDAIANYHGNFARDIVSAHLQGTKTGMLATAVVVDGARAPYTGMMLTQGIVQEVVPYPFIPIPAHTGITLLSPATYTLFEQLFDYAQKTDFESVLFPLLAEQRRLYSTTIPTEAWFQVNDPKSLASFVEALDRELDRI